MDNTEMIFSAEVDFQHNWKREGFFLQEGKEYKNGFADDLEPFSSKDVEDVIVKTIESELQKDIYTILGYETKVKINNVSYGSITVVFTVIGATYFAISKYKNFIESCELIQRQIQKLLRKRLKEKFGEDTFYVSVDIEKPFRKHRRFIDKEPRYEVAIDGRNQRDGFFYFLLIGFLFLASILGVLVYYSFTQTYFK